MAKKYKAQKAPNEVGGGRLVVLWHFVKRCNLDSNFVLEVNNRLDKQTSKKQTVKFIHPTQFI